MFLDGIKSEDMSVGDLFKNFYIVPDYQREFVWNTAEVEKLLDDIHNEYSQINKNYRPDYFIGSIVTNYERGGETFDLIDGQQRITTLYVFLCAVRDFLNEKGKKTKSLDSQLAFMALNEDGEEIPRHRVELQYEDSQRVVEKLVKERSEVPLTSIEPTTRSGVNLLQAYLDSNAFLVQTLGGDESEVKKFYAYLMKNVKLIRIKTESLNRALWIFETINDRGRGLDAMDLLKNLLFRNAEDHEFDILKKRWKALIDSLFNAKEKPLRFIRYFILANYAGDRLQADHVYSWLSDNDKVCEYGKDPIGFTERLLSAANAYVNFINGKLEDGTDCRYLKNIWHMSHSTRQHLVLMLAARNLSNQAVIELAKEVESLYFVYIVTRRPKNYFEQKFVEWAKEIRKMKTDKQLKVFLEKNLIPERVKLKGQFEMAIREMVEFGIPKYRLKYILAKMALYVDELAYGKSSELSFEAYIASNVNIEHILALTAKKEDIESFGGIALAEKCKHMIGNMTLLEKPINVSVGNKGFPEKNNEYLKSKFLLTAGLNKKAKVGKKTSVNKALENVIAVEEWNVAAFNKRTDALVDLAKKVWETPSAKGE